MTTLKARVTKTIPLTSLGRITKAQTVELYENDHLAQDEEGNIFIVKDKNGQAIEIIRAGTTSRARRGTTKAEVEEDCRRLLRALAEGEYTPQELENLASVSHLNADAIRHRLNKLVDQGKVRKTNTGTYMLRNGE